MPFDIEEQEADIHARLRSLVPDLRSVESADDFEQALQRATNVPAAFTLLGDAPSDGRHIVGSKKQVVRPKWSVLIVTQSWRSKAGAREGVFGAYQIGKQVKKALVGWLPAGALKSFIYEDYKFFARAQSRVAYELLLRTSAEDTFE